MKILEFFSWGVSAHIKHVHRVCRTVRSVNIYWFLKGDQLRVCSLACCSRDLYCSYVCLWKRVIADTFLSVKMVSDVRETLQYESHFVSSNWITADVFNTTHGLALADDVRLLSHNAITSPQSASRRLRIGDISYVIDHPLPLLQVIGTVIRWTNDFLSFQQLIMAVWFSPTERGRQTNSNLLFPGALMRKVRSDS